jgi:DNA-binding NtrC family response regulator
VAFALGAEFQVSTADRGRTALGMVAEAEYDTVVLDIRMPEMDGIRTLEELRRIDPLVSVIMLTGYGTLQTAQQAMVGGANQYLRKPPDVTELLDAVRKQVAATRERRAQTAAAGQAAALNEALRREIRENEPRIWQATASVELVHDLSNPLLIVVGYAALAGKPARRLGPLCRPSPPAGRPTAGRRLELAGPQRTTPGRRIARR